MVQASPHRDTAARLKFLLRSSLQWFCTVGSIEPSRNSILSNIKFKSNQIILEGIAYE